VAVSESEVRGDVSEAYSHRERARAINLSALIGWIVAIAPYLVHPGGILGALAWLPWLAVVGLPIAFAVTWLFAGPVLWRVMQHPVSWVSAVKWGAVISLGMAAGGLAFSRFQGWRASQDPNFDFQLGGGDYIREVDGVLTPYGWQMELLGSLQFILTGIAVALIVRWIMGSGRRVAR
jgi:hypothetical protein